MSLWETTRCPECNGPGARKFLWVVKCPNRDCGKYDGSVAFEQMHGGPPAAPQRPLEGNFNPGANSVQIRYLNHAGEEKTFTGDRATIHRRSEHLSICLVPTGQRCSFAVDRLRNLPELEAAVPEDQKRFQALSATDRQVLGYHEKHGTTSPRYEEVKRKLGT